MQKVKAIIRQNNRLRFLVVVLSIALVGTAVIAFSKAAVSTASFEPELGTLTTAQSINDATASGGKALQFTAATPADPMNVYFGSTHNHTGSGNDHGTDTSTANDILSAGKAKGFNFMFITEHSGQTGPLSQGMDPAVFYADVKAKALQNTNSTFVGVEGAEFSDNDTCNGIKEDHMTVVGTDAFLNPDGCASNGSTMMDYVYQQRQAGVKAFAGFNHPGSNGHAAGTADKLTANRRAVTVMSEVMNGVFDAEGSDDGNYQGFVKMLDIGWRIGAVCGLDGHGLFRVNTVVEATGKYFCRTGALMPSLTRANLDDAFINRRIYTSRDANLNVKYKVNGSWMGSTIGTPATLNFDITVSDPDTGQATDKIKKIEIMTSGGVNGTVVQSQTFDSFNVSWQPSIQANSKKYFFLRIYNGEHTSFVAVASPVWLE